MVQQKNILLALGQAEDDEMLVKVLAWQASIVVKEFQRSPFIADTIFKIIKGILNEKSKVFAKNSEKMLQILVNQILVKEGTEK